jgi:hypothetical protein
MPELKKFHQYFSYVHSIVMNSFIYQMLYKKLDAKKIRYIFFGYFGETKGYPI